MREQNISVIESTVTDIVKSDWTGDILGVQATTKGRADYVSIRNRLCQLFHPNIVLRTVLRHPYLRSRRLRLQVPQRLRNPHARLTLEILRPRTHRRAPPIAKSRPRHPRRRHARAPLPNRHARDARPRRHSRGASQRLSRRGRRQGAPAQCRPPRPSRGGAAQLRGSVRRGQAAQHAQQLPAAQHKRDARARRARRCAQHAPPPHRRRHDGRLQRRRPPR